jgi:uncharacterized membrane protein
LDSLFLWLAYHFDREMFLQSTVIQGFLWSIADFCLVFGFLRLASLVRERLKMRKTMGRYVLFWIAAILNPYFLLYKTGTKHDMLIMSIFFLAIYVALVDGLKIVRFLKHVLSDRNCLLPDTG